MVAQWFDAFTETPSMLPKLIMRTPHLQQESTDASPVDVVNAKWPDASSSEVAAYMTNIPLYGAATGDRLGKWYM
jgi:hypothetical protein